MDNLGAALGRELVVLVQKKLQSSDLNFRREQLESVAPLLVLLAGDRGKQVTPSPPALKPLPLPPELV
jgi:hypothetical protein